VTSPVPAGPMARPVACLALWRVPVRGERARLGMPITGLPRRRAGINVASRCKSQEARWIRRGS
jgi:hypothetical protein